MEKNKFDGVYEIGCPTWLIFLSWIVMFKQRKSREINWNFNKFRTPVKKERKERGRTNSKVNEKSMQETVPRIERENCVRFSFVWKERQGGRGRDFFWSIFSPFVFFLAGVYISTRQGRLPLSSLLAQLTLDQPRRNFVSCCANHFNHGIKLSINWVGKILKSFGENFKEKFPISWTSGVFLLCSWKKKNETMNKGNYGCKICVYSPLFLYYIRKKSLFFNFFFLHE